eukprot:1143946-Prorocentrum_minimum.AAC.2
MEHPCNTRDTTRRRRADSRNALDVSFAMSPFERRPSAGDPRGQGSLATGTGGAGDPQTRTHAHAPGARVLATCRARGP